jgi:hypothetical protein
MKKSNVTSGGTKDCVTLSFTRDVLMNAGSYK